MSEIPPQISALVAQFPVSQSIQDNLAAIQEIISQARPGDLVLTPEGSVSGYSNDLSFLEHLDPVELRLALDQLHAEAQKQQIFLWVGACLLENGRWFNAACGFDSHGGSHIYHKINLATHERGTFTPGGSLPIFELHTSSGTIKLGVQLCRELKFPEQWGWLARNGAQIILHLNNATGSSLEQPVWRSHLISRAAENQRYVLSANCAAQEQKSPTLVIAPSGEILAEVVSDKLELIRLELDLAHVSNWYLSQCRQDIVAITGIGEKLSSKPSE